MSIFCWGHFHLLGWFLSFVKGHVIQDTGQKHYSRSKIFQGILHNSPCEIVWPTARRRPRPATSCITECVLRTGRRSVLVTRVLGHNWSLMYGQGPVTTWATFTGWRGLAWPDMPPPGSISKVSTSPAPRSCSVVTTSQILGSRMVRVADQFNPRLEARTNIHRQSYSQCIVLGFGVAKKLSESNCASFKLYQLGVNIELVSRPGLRQPLQYLQPEIAAHCHCWGGANIYNQVDDWMTITCTQGLTNNQHAIMITTMPVWLLY